MQSHACWEILFTPTGSASSFNRHREQLVTDRVNAREAGSREDDQMLDAQVSQMNISADGKEKITSKS